MKTAHILTLVGVMIVSVLLIVWILTRPLTNPSVRIPAESISAVPITYTSQDSVLTVTYPESWQIVQTTPVVTPGTSPEVLQTWTISNANPEQDTNINFTITQNTNNQTIDEIITCEPNEVIECATVEINGINYKKLTQNTSSGLNSTIATIHENVIYRVDGFTSSFDTQGEQFRDLETIMNSIQLQT